MADRPDPVTMLAAIIETLAGEPFVAPALIEAGRKAVHELTARTAETEEQAAERELAQPNPPLNALQAVRERLEWIAARMSNDNPEQAENSEALERLAEVEAYLASLATAKTSGPPQTPRSTQPAHRRRASDALPHPQQD
jgi:hypothetical protein